MLLHAYYLRLLHLGDGYLPKRCPTKYQRLFMIGGDYRV